jgi:hypothetical protein
LLELGIAVGHLDAGDLIAAERRARNAVDFFAPTDLTTFAADSWLIYGDVLRAAARRPEADRAFDHARDLYRQKGSRVSVDAATARLAL